MTAAPSAARTSALRRLGLGRWTGFLLRRLAALLTILAILICLTFLLVRLIPGDPALNLAGPEANDETIAAIRRLLDLDRPIHEQFATYVEKLAHGDMGYGFYQRQPVSQIIANRLPYSAQLAAIALVIVLALSIPFGILMGTVTREGRHRRLEVAFMAATSVIGSIPEFLMATVLAFLFAVWLRLLPVGGSEGWQSIVLPVAAIAIRPTFSLSRIVRLETLNVLAQDYIRTVRGKRMPTRIILVRHVLPNVMTAALAIGGIFFAGLVGGTVLVENVFARLGLGTSLVAAVQNHDYPVVQGIVLVLGVTVVTVNTIVDILLAVVDPRSLAGRV